MKWNLSLIVVCLGLMICTFLLMETISLAQAESISEEVAQRIDVDEDRLRKEMTPVLREANSRLAVFSCSPLGFLVFLIVGKMVYDKKTKQ